LNSEPDPSANVPHRSVINENHLQQGSYSIGGVWFKRR
jgi:hypothetical protein